MKIFLFFILSHTVWLVFAIGELSVEEQPLKREDITRLPIRGNRRIGAYRKVPVINTNDDLDEVDDDSPMPLDDSTHNDADGVVDDDYITTTTYYYYSEVSEDAVPNGELEKEAISAPIMNTSAKMSVNTLDPDLQTRHYQGNKSWKTYAPTTGRHQSGVKCRTPGKYRKKTNKNSHYGKYSSKSSKHKSRYPKSSPSPSNIHEGNTPYPTEVGVSCAPTTPTINLNPTNSPSPTSRSPFSDCQYLDCPRPLNVEQSPGPLETSAPSSKPIAMPFGTNSVSDEPVENCKALDCPRPVNPTGQ